MNIGLLTIHHAYNFGAALQAYATYDTLKAMGHEVEFIDYDNDTFRAERNLFLPNTSVGNVARNLRTIFTLKQGKSRVNRFEDFYKLSKKSEKTWLNDIDFSEISYDAILVGSDQTFGLYLTGNPMDMRPFFLEKAGDIKRISYASSMGEKTATLTDADNQWMAKQFRKFSSILVRDEKTASYIESLIGYRPDVVLDPTLLVSEKRWSQLASNYKIQGDYIAFYTVLSAPWVISYVENLSKKLGIRVIALNARTRFEIKANYQFIGDCGPREFLSIIKNAKYVVTTSFHATAFSVIFQRQFVSLVLGEGNKLSSFLHSLSLSNRAIHEAEQDNIELFSDCIPYQNVKDRLIKLQEHSFKSLKNSLEQVEQEL